MRFWFPLSRQNEYLDLEYIKQLSEKDQEEEDSDDEASRGRVSEGAVASNGHFEACLVIYAVSDLMGNPKSPPR